MQCGICYQKDEMDHRLIKDHSISKQSFTIAKCKNCGLIYTMDAPGQEDIHKYYASENYISHSDTRTGIIANLYHKVRSLMLKRKYKLIASYHSRGRLLDFGCGTGYFAHYMMGKGYTISGVEIDDGARTHAIQNFKVDAHGIEYMQKPVIEKFDVITLWHVLEHIYDLQQYMQFFYESLAQNGHLIIAVPNHMSLDAKIFGEFWAAYDVPRHLWHFDTMSMAKLATICNFEIISKEHMPFDPFYNSMLSASYKGSFSKLIVGFCTGLVAYIKGAFDVDKASSIIYIMRKKYNFS
jgi:2-polyprenyl-3-methyl-5-hydroxy-6-metoxy-1,4-benzoquinol methylase